MTTVRADVAAMLRAGASYREIHEQLGVSSSTIARTRTVLRIPTPKRPGPTPEERRAAIEERHPRVAAMLRAGATVREIAAATGATPPTVSLVRRVLGIPVPERPSPARTIAETLARYAEPHGAGHVRWTGPTANGQPQAWAQGRLHNARHEIFRAHHGRPPEGPVRTACDEPGCIAGAHLTDRRIRHANARADKAFDAIFNAPTSDQSDQ